MPEASTLTTIAPRRVPRGRFASGAGRSPRLVARAGRGVSGDVAGAQGAHGAGARRCAAAPRSPGSRMRAACGARGAQRSSGPRCRAARHPATPKHQTLTLCARSRSLSLSVGETGWGEFDITITVHFQPDANEKPLELAHMLKLYAAAGAGGAAGRSLRALSGAGGLPAAGRSGAPGAARRLAKATQRHRAPGG